MSIAQKLHAAATMGRGCGGGTIQFQAASELWFFCRSFAYSFK
jgi:hypothetical protein